MLNLRGVKGEIEIKCVAQLEQGLNKTIPIEFVCTWKKLEVEEATEALDRIRTREIPDREIARLFLLNIKGLRDADTNDEFEYDDALVDELYKHREYKRAIIDSFFLATTGRKTALEKNL